MSIQVNNFVVNTRGGKSTHRVSIIIDGQVQLTGSIKIMKNYLGLQELVPQGMSDELKKELGYITESELVAMRKDFPNAQMWSSENIHIFEVSGSRDSYVDKKTNQVKWSDRIYWTRKGQRLDQRFNISMKQVLYKQIVELVTKGEVKSKKSMPITTDAEGNIIFNEEYYEKIDKTIEANYRPGRRMANGTADWNKINEELVAEGKNHSYRGFGEMIVDFKSGYSLHVSSMIRQYSSGRWALSTPGININRMRAMEVEGWQNFFDLDENGRMKNEKIKDGVKVEDLPDGLKKLINPENGRMYMNTMEFVNFRGNNTTAFYDETVRDEQGIIGPVMLVTGAVKKEILSTFFAAAKEHGLAIDPDVDGSNNGEALTGSIQAMVVQ